MAARSTRVPLGSNPYVVGPPVYGAGPFFGRQAEIEHVLAAAQKGDGLVRLTGAPRIGKSSCLRHIAAGKRAGLLPVYLDLSDFVGQEAAGVLRVLAQDVCKIAGIDEVEGLGLVPSEWAAGLYSALQPKVKRRRLLLLVDVAAYSVDDDVLAALVALASAGARASGVFASAPSIDLAAHNTALAAAESIELGVLSNHEARALITEPLAKSISWDEDALLHVLDLTGRHPALVQALCNEIFEVLRARPVDSVGMMEVVGGARRLEDVSSALEWLWRPLDPGQRVLLAAMAEAAPIDRSVFLEELREVLVGFQVDPGDEVFQQVLRGLIDLSYLRREAANRVAFSVEILRRWIARHHPLESMREARLEGSTARSVAQRHLAAARDAQVQGHFNEAVEAFRRALEVDPDYLEARLGLGRALVEFGHFKEAVPVLLEARDAGATDATDEIAEAYLRWIEELKENKHPYDSVLQDAAELAPEHPGVRRAQQRRAVDQVRHHLASGRTKAAQRGLELIAEGGDGEGLSALRRPALEHLIEALETGAARRGRQVAEFVAALSVCFPKDPEPRLQFASYLVNEGETLEATAPPSALSHYRRATETLGLLPEGFPVPTSLRSRIEAGERRIATLFVREQEASLEQLWAAGQFDAAQRLAEELAADQDSVQAKRILERVRRRSALAQRHERILELMAQGDRDQAALLAGQLHEMAPDFVGQDGRTAADLLKAIGAEAQVGERAAAEDDHAFRGSRRRLPQATAATPTAAARRAEPAAPVLPVPTPAAHARTMPPVPAAAPVAPAPVASAAAPAPAQRAPAAQPAAGGSVGPLPIPPPPPPRSNAPLWAAIALLGAVVLAQTFWSMREVTPPTPAANAMRDRRASETPAPTPVPKVFELEPIPQPVAKVVEPEPTPVAVSDAAELAPAVAPAEVAPNRADPAAEAPKVQAQVAPKPAANVAQAEPRPGQLPLDVEGPRQLSREEISKAEALVMDGRKQVQLGSYRGAAEDYRLSLEINPNQPGVLQDLGLVYYVLKRFDEAEQVLKRSLALKPSTMARFDLAKVYRAQERHAEARAEFERALAENKLPPSMAKEARDYLKYLDQTATEEALKALEAPAAAEPAPARKTEADLWGEGASKEVLLFGGGADNATDEKP